MGQPGPTQHSFIHSPSSSGPGPQPIYPLCPEPAPDTHSHSRHPRPSAPGGPFKRRTGHAPDPAKVPEDRRHPAVNQGGRTQPHPHSRANSQPRPPRPSASALAPHGRRCCPSPLFFPLRRPAGRSSPNPAPRRTGHPHTGPQVALPLPRRPPASPEFPLHPPALRSTPSPARFPQLPGTPPTPSRRPRHHHHSFIHLLARPPPFLPHRPAKQHHQPAYPQPRHRQPDQWREARPRF